MATCSSSSSLCATFYSISRPSYSSKPRFVLFNSGSRTGAGRFRCSAGQTGFFTKLGRLIKEKAKSDVEKIFSGFSKTRNNLAVIDELLLYWNLSDTDQLLDQLEEALLVSDFGPKITIKIVENLREDILSGKLKSGNEIKVSIQHREHIGESLDFIHGFKESS